MANPKPCIYFNRRGCTQPFCQFSHDPDDRSIQIAPNSPNICKKYLLDPQGCHRFPGTCWYSHDILSSGHANFQKLYNLLSEIRKTEFQKTGQHDTGSFVARFMNMLVEERYAKDGVAFVAADAITARNMIGDRVLTWLGGVESDKPQSEMGNGKRKRSDAGGDDAQTSHRSKLVKIKEEPKDENTDPLHNIPNNPPRPPRRPNRPVKIKQEPGTEPSAVRPSRADPPKKKKKNNNGRVRGRGRRGMSDREVRERENNFGLSANDLNTMLSYGMKPWDDNAYDVL